MILQAIKNWTVGRPGTKLPTVYQYETPRLMKVVTFSMFYEHLVTITMITGFSSLVIETHGEGLGAH